MVEQKTFADEQINEHEKSDFVLGKIENIFVKGENPEKLEKNTWKIYFCKLFMNDAELSVKSEKTTFVNFS